MRRVKAVVVGAAALWVGLTGAAAAANELWTGAYFGWTMGAIGRGSAEYTFATDGWYNDNPGDTFTQPLDGNPLGMVFGYQWRQGNFVYGFEAFIQSHGISGVDSCLVLFPAPPPGVCGAESPFNPDHDFDIKGHWFTGVSARAGYALGRVLFYGQAGFLYGHLVQEQIDNANNYSLWDYGTVLGVTAGAGFDIAVGPRIAVGFGYQGIWLRSMDVAGPSVDRVTDLPVIGTESEHSIRYNAHAINARLTIHTGERRDEEPRPPFDWARSHWGFYFGALWQAGFENGRDFIVRDRNVIGGSIQVSLDACCGIALEVGANLRIGRILAEDFLLYTEVGYGYQTGTFFGVVDGAYFWISRGVEIALSERTSAFVEVKRIGNRDLGFADYSWQGGFNFWPASR